MLEERAWFLERYLYDFCLPWGCSFSFISILIFFKHKGWGMGVG